MPKLSTLSNRSVDRRLMRASRLLAGCGLIVAVAAGCNPFALLPTLDPGITTTFLKWNQLGDDAAALDHTPVAAGESRTFGHQLGPVKHARAMAISHIAMFDALNAVTGGYKSYTQIDAAPLNTSAVAAIAQAGHDALAALYPSHVATFDDALAADLAGVVDPIARANGVNVGQAAAAAILAMREGDGSDDSTPYVLDPAAGKWRPDPINPGQSALGANYYLIKPFALNSASQFRAAAPPALDSAEYTTAYAEVLALGGDGITTPHARTSDQTQTGIYWGYDGSARLGAPPRLYNQIARQIASDRNLEGVALARMLTLANVAMADAGIACWETKYYYNYWRPISGIREAAADGNAATTADLTYVPLCAPASNSTNNNFTPPFPAYPSGHATFGAALFQTLRDVYGTDEIAFTFTSDELNGVTTDNTGAVRPLAPRSFDNLSQAEEENGQSRIYLGIHWSFDKTAGITMGRSVADHVYGSVFQPN